ncbi:MAG: hypothetical protein QOG15_548 [Solirubrobacteraceae bacterium]|jgi:hypothetical protein|nr:hypothetical protein [Solirubrobacteraceae bacterium]
MDPNPVGRWLGPDNLSNGLHTIPEQAVLGFLTDQLTRHRANQPTPL